ncbi:MAG: Spo0B domain-containing protein [Alicyclobacillus sp.]|nr:Spo0B domain-containing protein [Alicyclobacillus sp.]
MTSQAQEHVNRALQAFRKHRHDVLNELQVVRGYLQLQRTEAALKVLDRIAGWFQSLTALQLALDVQNHPEHAELVWCAAGLPHVQFRGASDDWLAGDAKVPDLCRCWQWLEESAGMAGLSSVPIYITRAPDGSQVICQIERTEEIARWWETVKDDQVRQFGDVKLACVSSPFHQRHT